MYKILTLTANAATIHGNISIEKWCKQSKVKNLFDYLMLIAIYYSPLMLSSSDLITFNMQEFLNNTKSPSILVM